MVTTYEQKLSVGFI